MDAPGRVMLRCVPTLVDAHFLKGYLSAAGIESEIRGDAAHPLSALPNTPAYELWVATVDRERAASVLMQAEHGSGEHSQSIECVNCGEENPANFEVCWKCGGFTRVEDRSKAQKPTAPETFFTQRGMMAAVAVGILLLLVVGALR